MHPAAWAVPALFIAVAGGCAQQPPVEPSLPDRGDLIALVPKANGTAGAVVVHQGDETILLDTPYAAARIRGSDRMEATHLAPEEVKQLFGSALAALPPRPVNFVLYFVEGKDELTVESKGAIDAVRQELARRPAPEITVTGHTDELGSDRFNDQLSLQRAKRVTEELIRAGVDPALIATHARGRREPVFPTGAGKAEPRNRRVEITAR